MAGGGREPLCVPLNHRSVRGRCFLSHSAGQYDSFCLTYRFTAGYAELLHRLYVPAGKFNEYNGGDDRHFSRRRTHSCDTPHWLYHPLSALSERCADAVFDACLYLLSGVWRDRSAALVGFSGV